MWRGTKAAPRGKRQDLANVDQQCARFRLDCYPPAIGDSNFKTTVIVFER
jgi:hypothetical protein